MGLIASKTPVPSFSPFWEKKTKTFFRRIDWESSGRISRKDFNTLADYYIQLSKLDSNSKRGRQVRRRFIKMWEEFYEKASTNGEIDENAYVQATKKLGVAKLTEIVQRYSDFYFDLLDSNGNGTITKDEFTAFGKLFRFPDKSIDETFKTLNRNKDGNVTDDEFLKAYMDFTLGDDPKSPYSNFMGPLVSP
jgi:Ca2+-binding EF-hand superfamily protein